MDNLEAIIFDLDGTLWSTIDCSYNTLKEVQERHPDITREISKEEVRKSMGLPFDVIVKNYYGYLDFELAVSYAKEAFNKNVENLLKFGGTLYSGLEDTIKKLSNEYKLCIVSNCVEGYIESFLKTSNLGSYFTDYECNGKTKLTKGENIKLIMERNNIKSAVYVGDTMGDKEAAKDANIPFIYAAYGFGDVDNYDYRIDSITDLENI